MFVRRRPIARAAVVGGIAYQAGKRGAAAGEREAEEQAAAAAPPPAPAAPAGGMSDAVIQQLKELASLRDSGVLTDDEFNAQKAKLLGS
jgi:hypothetical protein